MLREIVASTFFAIIINSQLTILQSSMQNRFAIVDIETTGSHSSSHGITEIAILVHDTTQVIDSFQTLINPEIAVMPYVTKLTGITNEMLYDAPTFQEVAKKIWQMTEGCVFVAHSVNFDYSYIHKAFKSLGADFRRKKLCTVRLSRKLFPGFASYSLGNICSQLSIPIKNRHRAMGDAEATVKLFEHCLQNDKENFITTSLKKKSLEATLPPHLPKEVYDALPEETGVYYMHDVKGKIIYVGKAINIKSRIYSHITGKGSRLSFINSIANITWELCGTELIALLRESHDIKHHYPLYNQAQKSNRGNYILTDYTDRNGIQRLQFIKNHPLLHSLKTFKSYEEARQFMFRFMEDHELCPKCCGMQTAKGACFDYQVKKCKGICAGKENIETYNQRVEQALQTLADRYETKLIIDAGRQWNEKSVVVIENGEYKGFGFFDSAVTVNNVEEAKNIIQPYQHTADVTRILKGMNVWV